MSFYYLDFGIFGELSSFFSILSITELFFASLLCSAVSVMLVIINIIAITVVNFVKKLPALLDDINESLPEEPIPKAPPSDF